MVIPEFQGTKNIKEPEKAKSQYLAMTTTNQTGLMDNLAMIIHEFQGTRFQTSQKS